MCVVAITVEHHPGLCRSDSFRAPILQLIRSRRAPPCRSPPTPIRDRRILASASPHLLPPSRARPSSSVPSASSGQWIVELPIGVAALHPTSTPPAGLGMRLRIAGKRASDAKAAAVDGGARPAAFAAAPDATRDDADGAAAGPADHRNGTENGNPHLRFMTRPHCFNFFTWFFSRPVTIRTTIFASSMPSLAKIPHHRRRRAFSSHCSSFTYSSPLVSVLEKKKLSMLFVLSSSFQLIFLYYIRWWVRGGYRRSAQLCEKRSNKFDIFPPGVVTRARLHWGVSCGRLLVSSGDRVHAVHFRLVGLIFHAVSGQH